MRRVTRSLLVLTAMSAVLGACSASGESPAPATTATTIATSTTPATQPTTTAEPASSTTFDEEAALEAELVAVIDGANTVFLANPIEPDSPIVEQYYSESLAAEVRANLESRAAADESYFGSIKLEAIYSAEINGSSAVVRACALDGVGVLASDGTVAIAAATEANLVDYELVLEDASWRLDVVRFPGAERQTCE